MKPTPRPSPTLALVLGLAMLSGCDEGPESPLFAEGPTVVTLSAGFPYAACEGDQEAYDAADGVWIRLGAPGTEPVFDEVLPFTPAAQETAVRIDVELARESALLLEAELRRGSAPLFRGSADVTLVPGQAATATVPLLPVPADVVVSESVGPLSSIGETAPLEGSVLFATGDVACSLTLQWTSLEPDVAEVVATGGTRVARALADGVARIRASHGSLADTVRVTVDLVVTTVEVEPASGTVGIGATLQLTAAARDALGNVLPGRPASWSSGDPGVASVDGNGLVRGRGIGTATLTATVEGVDATAVVEVVPGAPDVTTFEAVGVGARVATLQGIVNPRGAPTEVWFEWATDPALDGAASTEPVSAGSGSVGVPVAADLAGLQPATPHYFRAVARNEVGTRRGAIRRFDTQAQPPPSVLTRPATEVGARVATLEGTVNPNGAGTDAWFEWSTDPSLEDAVSTEPVSVGSGSGDVSVSADLSELSPGTSYYFRAVAGNEAGTTVGEVLSFETGAQPAPSVLTLLPSGVGTSEATLQGSVDPNGAETEAWFEWATNASLDDPFTTAPRPVGSGTSAVIVTADLVELQPETEYWVRVVAENVGGTSVGDILGFQTAIPAPSDLSVDQAGTSNFLGWQDNSTTEASFRIERSTVSPSSGFTVIATVDPNAESFEDPPPLPSGTVHYRVRACGDQGCSAPSNVVSVSVPPAVIQGTVTVCGAACTPVVGIQVTLTGPSNRATTTDANGQYQFSGLPAGTYTVSVADQPCDPAIDFDPNSRVVTVSGGGDVDVANFQGALVICQ